MTNTAPPPPPGADLLLAWPAANQPALCGHWHRVGPVWAGDLLTRIRPVLRPNR